MQPHQVFWEICNLTNYENISYSINVLIKLLGKYFISNYPSNQNFWEICNLIKFFEKYVISSSMIFRNVSICRSCKKMHRIFHLIWIKLIQIILDKTPNWMWIILQLLYRVFFSTGPPTPENISGRVPYKNTSTAPPPKSFKYENHIEVLRHLDLDLASLGL